MGGKFSCFSSKAAERDQLREKGQDAWEAYKEDKNDLAALTRCIEAFRPLAVDKKEHDRTGTLSYLILALCERTKLESDHQEEDLNEATRYTRQINLSFPKLAFDEMKRINLAMADAYLARYYRSEKWVGDANQLKACIKYLQEVADCTSQAPTEIVEAKVRLASALLLQNKVGEAIETLWDAKSRCFRDRGAAGATAARLSRVVKALAGAYCMQYSDTSPVPNSPLRDIDKSIECLNALVLTCQQGFWEVPSLVRLASLILTEAEKTPITDRSLDSLNSLVRCTRQAIAFCQGANLDLQNLAIQARITLAQALLFRSHAFPNDTVVEHVDESIDLFNQARQSHPHPRLQSSLANAIFIRCERFKDIPSDTSLDQAISLYEELLTTADPKENQGCEIAYYNLATLYLHRFTTFSQEKDLRSAVVYYQNTVSICIDQTVREHCRKQVVRLNQYLDELCRHNSTGILAAGRTHPKPSSYLSDNLILRHSRSGLPPMLTFQ